MQFLSFLALADETKSKQVANEFFKFKRKSFYLTLEGIGLKNVTQRDGRGVGRSIGTLYSTFDTIHPIDLIFGTYNDNELSF